MKFYLIALSVLLLFTGCGKKLKPAVVFEPKALPSWVENPPVSNNTTIYAIGEGSSKEDAIANGLNEMLSTLSVSLESDFRAEATSKRVNGFENYYEDINSVVKTKVKELRISNYKVEGQAKRGFNKYVVLLSSNKQGLFNSLKDEIDKKITLLNSEEKAHKSVNVLKQFSFYKKASEDVDGFLYKSVIMKAIVKSFDDKYIQKSVSHYKNSFSSLRSKISFSVKSDSNSKNLVPVIKDTITSNGFKISNSKNRYHMNIYVSSKSIKAESYGFTLARTSIAINLKDYNNQTLSTKKLDLIGQSTQGYRVAREDVAYKLKEIVDEEGIKSIIEIDL